MPEHAATVTLDWDYIERVLKIPVLPWQRAFAEAVLSPPCEPIRDARPPIKYHGDPTLGGDGLCLAIDADCPHCGWPERTYDTRTRHFGCIKCTYTSDERNA